MDGPLDLLQEDMVVNHAWTLGCRLNSGSRRLRSGLFCACAHNEAWVAVPLGDGVWGWGAWGVEVRGGEEQGAAASVLWLLPTLACISPAQTPWAQSHLKRGPNGHRPRRSGPQTACHLRQA